MPDDAAAFMPPEGQTEYAFPPDQGQQDDVATSDQRNQQIQQAFDQQRFQRSFIQGVGKTIANQGAQIDRLSRQQQKT